MQHGAWREEEAINLLSSTPEIAGDSKNEMRDFNSRASILARTKWQRGEERLLYWGFSYGTVLGATFAALQPHRVSRVLLDGVVDTPDYYRTDWDSSLEAGDLILDRFSEYCFEAGPDGCAFYTSGSPKDIKNSFRSLFQRLRNNPIGVPGNTTRGPQIITWSDAKQLVFFHWYSPVSTFNQTAALLADLRDGTGVEFAEYKQKHIAVPSRSSSNFADELEPGENEDEVCTAILCTDGDDISNLTQAGFRPYWEKLHQKSDSVGDIWAQIRMRCAGWHARPKWRFTGPFSAVTEHPIMLIGNSLEYV
jgi:hypothetical protein